MEFSRNFVCETYEKCTRQKHVSAPVFRKSFTLQNKPTRAMSLRLQYRKSYAACNAAVNICTYDSIGSLFFSTKIPLAEK